ncbi:hypothetical protein GCM10008956_08250 [Deinococcus arenae]|uniref:Uncharacterized protein n=1 Tax=Deinococcus arenae TaxID=1452751 RepID=A0A8H9L665_9DEIO|nr:hypothetical protein [Deinococcus arenae]GGM34232.1 hypothetical protein GCM10008956_08250 [Deinococcus arenae]
MTPLLILALAAVLIVLATRRAPPPAEPGPAAAAPAPAPTADDLLRLPEPARTRAWALLCSLHDALREPPGDARSTFLLQQTRDQYLPDTVSAYLHLTPAARAQLDRQGQPPETLLLEQLTLIEGGVTEVLRRDHAAADRLLTQGRFLRERFSPPAGGELRVEDR